MKDMLVVSKTGMNVMDGCLIVSMDGNLNTEAIERLGREILEQVRAIHPKGVILNVSAVKMLDSRDFSILGNISKAVSMMGSRMVFVGFQPGVASSLVDLDMNLDHILTAVATGDAIEIIREGENGSEQLEKLMDSAFEPGPGDDVDKELLEDE